MRITSALLGLAMLGAGGVALADEPLRLDAAQLDAVSAGTYSTLAVGFTFPGFGTGNLINSFQLSQQQTISATQITPTSFQANASAQAAAVSQVQSLGVGATSSGAGGGVFTTVVLF